MDQQADGNQPAEPRDARQTTAEQRELQDKLDHQDVDPDAPGRQQSGDDIAGESTR